VKGMFWFTTWRRKSIVFVNVCQEREARKGRMKENDPISVLELLFFLVSITSVSVQF
jgi:hypothetical protein